MIQGKFQVARKIFSTKDDVRASEGQIYDKKKSPNYYRIVEDKRPAVKKKIRSMAASQTDYGHFRSYKLLIDHAIHEISSDAARSARVIPNRTFTTRDRKRKVPEEPTATAQPGTYDPTTRTDEEKIADLRAKRRALSPEVNRDADLAAFRNRKVMVEMTSKREPTRFSIGYGGSFLLGDSATHSYTELFANLKRSTGLSNAQVADTVITALIQRESHLSDYEGEALRNLRKIVALIHGPESRRAAINPVAAVAALDQVQEDDDPAEALRRHTLFARTDGGALNSRYHNQTVAQTPEFKETAVREHDAIMAFAARNGVDTNDDAAVNLFVAQMAQAAVNALKEHFTFKPQ